MQPQKLIFRKISRRSNALYTNVGSISPVSAKVAIFRKIVPLSMY